MKTEEIIKTERKYATASLLDQAINRYLDSIRVTSVKHKRVGKDEYVEVTNDFGEPVVGYYYHEPPGVAGLCLSLGISKKTWWNYCSTPENEDLHEVCERFRLLCENYYNNGALQGTINQKQAQLNLEANYGWRQVQEIELGKKTREAVSANSKSMAEKLAVIKAAAKDLD